MPNSLSRRGTAMLAIGLAASLGVAACGSKKSGGSAGGAKNYKMTLVAGVKGDEFYITMNCGAQAQAKKLGVSLGFQGPDQFDPSLQTPIVSAGLARFPDLKGIFATNLFSAEGSASGLRSAGKLSKVKIVGFDAGPKQVKDLKDGVVQGLIAQRPAEIGADGVQQAYNALTGKPVKNKIGTGFVSLTKSNLSANQDALYKSHC